MVGKVIAVRIHCRALGACVGACSGAAEIAVLVLRPGRRNGIKQAGARYEKRARGVNSTPSRELWSCSHAEYGRDYLSSE